MKTVGENVVSANWIKSQARRTHFDRLQHLLEVLVADVTSLKVKSSNIAAVFFLSLIISKRIYVEKGQEREKE